MGGAEYRDRRLDLEGLIRRETSSAGRLNQAELELVGWTARVGRSSRDHRWVLSGGEDDVSGRLSARVETWPFASIWETLSAQAYRLNGDLTARSAWLGLERRGLAGAGWSWGARVQRVTLRLDRRSWYVTTFGFGRTDQQTTAAGVDPSLIVTLEVERRTPAFGGSTGVRLVVGAPVSADRVDGGSTVDGSGLPGYALVRLEWSR